MTSIVSLFSNSLELCASPMALTTSKQTEMQSIAVPRDASARQVSNAQIEGKEGEIGDFNVGMCGSKYRKMV